MRKSKFFKIPLYFLATYAGIQLTIYHLFPKTTDLRSNTSTGVVASLRGSMPMKMEMEMEMEIQIPHQIEGNIALIPRISPKHSEPTRTIHESTHPIMEIPNTSGLTTDEQSNEHLPSDSVSGIDRFYKLNKKTGEIELVLTSESEILQDPKPTGIADALETEINGETLVNLKENYFDPNNIIATPRASDDTSIEDSHNGSFREVARLLDGSNLQDQNIQNIDSLNDEDAAEYLELEYRLITGKALASMRLEK